MPAAAVIPASIAYIKVVAVKKLVVELVRRAVGSPSAVSTGVSRGVLPVGAVCVSAQTAQSIPPRCSSLSVEEGRHVYFEQIRVLKAGRKLA